MSRGRDAAEADGRKGCHGPLPAFEGLRNAKGQRAPEGRKNSMKEKLAGVAALASALFASICCIGPLVLLGLGLGGAGLAASLARYRPAFLVLTAAFLGVAFYLAYRRREATCPDGSCEMRSGSKTMKAALWAVTAAAVGLASFPSWSTLLFGRSPAAVATANAETVKLAVSGMTCSGCAAGIEKALLEVPGVRSASVDFDGGDATVVAEPGAVPVARLLDAVKSAGAYTAEVKR